MAEDATARTAACAHDRSAWLMRYPAPTAASSGRTSHGHRWGPGAGGCRLAATAPYGARGARTWCPHRALEICRRVLPVTWTVWYLRDEIPIGRPTAALR